MDQRHTKPGLGTRYRELRRWGCRVPQPPHVNSDLRFPQLLFGFLFALGRWGEVLWAEKWQLWGSGGIAPFRHF